MPERYELERLLWDLRHVPATVDAVRTDPRATMDAYGLSGEEAEALTRQDFPALLALGVSPMLLYFGALEMGVSRDDYYAIVRGTDSVGGRH